MAADPIVHVVRRHLERPGDPQDVDDVIDAALDEQVELLDVLLSAAREIDWLRHQAHASIDAGEEDPKAVLGRVGQHRRARSRQASDDHEIRLRDVAAQARALVTRIRRDHQIDMGDVVRALEAIVEAAGVAE
jgi:hypothetical protein